MLEIVDAECHRLLVAHRAEMARHLHAALVGLFDGGAQIRAGDVGVDLDPRRSFGGPVVHEAPRRLRRGHYGHVRRSRLTGAGDVGRGHHDVRSHPMAVVDLTLGVDVRVRRVRSGRPDRGDARGEVEPRAREADPDLATACRRVEQMVVHPDHPRDERLPLAIDHLGPSWDLRSRAHGGDAATLDDDRTPRLRRSAGAIDQRHVGDRHDGAVHADERTQRVPLLRGERGGQDDGENSTQGAHGSSGRTRRQSTVIAVIMPASRCSAMWQCSIQVPGLDRSTSRSTVAPEGTNTVSFQARLSFRLPFTARTRKR